MLDQLRCAFTQSNLLRNSTAVFSSCQKYRYRLDRIWDDSLPPLAFGMLNPSTADHERNDATIERCERRAQSLGFGSLIVWNLFAFRATDPRYLLNQLDPIGPDNDHFIQTAITETKAREGTVIIGWGSQGQLLGRHLQVLEIARNSNVDLYCLGTTARGQPRHPLYISYESKPTVWHQTF
jgi:hypothetical protein